MEKCQQKKIQNPDFFLKIQKKLFKKNIWKFWIFFAKEKNAILLVWHLGRLVFDQSSPVHPISESRWGSRSVTDGGRRTNGRYSALQGLSSSSCGGLWPRPRLFCPSGKKELFMLFLLILGYFWCSVVTSVFISTNPNNFFLRKKKS